LKWGILEGQQTVILISWNYCVGSSFNLNLCWENREKIAEIARNCDFFLKTIFKEKIAGRWEKIGRLKILRNPRV
jgi:hypothetical protein